MVIVLKKYASPLIMVSRFAVASEEGMETEVFEWRRGFSSCALDLWVIGRYTCSEAIVLVHNTIIG